MSVSHEPDDRLLRMRWLALMINLSRDISAYASEFEALILEVPPKGKPK